MDLKHYYQKIRDIEAKIVDAFPLVVSRETADGGKEGTKTEVPKRLAAKLIVEGVARLANEEEAAQFQALQAEAIRAAEQLAAASKLQVTVLSNNDLERLKKAASK
jgi:tRNA isopentenyl-2-thiomethyl-A-37 hydroxylase MiaE